jgi:predicted acetyltransferase
MTGPATRLREALPRERDVVTQLLADYLLEFDGRTEPYPCLDAYWGETERLPLLVESGDEIVGVCLVRRRRDGWSIAELSIVPARRHGGCGRAAVEALVDRARSDRAAYLEAKVHPDNTAALPFWRAVGFVDTPGPGTGVIVLRRVVGNDL